MELKIIATSPSTHKCEWCVSRMATVVGLSFHNFWSYMCDECKERVCMQDEKGKYVTMTLEECDKKHPKGFYFS